MTKRKEDEQEEWLRDKRKQRNVRKEKEKNLRKGKIKEKWDRENVMEGKE